MQTLALVWPPAFMEFEPAHIFTRESSEFFLIALARGIKDSKTISWKSLHSHTPVLVLFLIVFTTYTVLQHFRKCMYVLPRRPRIRPTHDVFVWYLAEVTTLTALAVFCFDKDRELVFIRSL